MRDAADPLSDDELADLGRSALPVSASVVLAVSGGADSLCLLLMAAAVRGGPNAPHRSNSPTFHAATVDHGWRAEAADEARYVASLSGKLGIPHHVLPWVGPKPKFGRQDAARTARYRLLTGLATASNMPGPVVIATAHHSDDQAETFLMRLARGSGVDGLSGMGQRRRLTEVYHLRSDVFLVRPFLDVPKARLVATLLARNIAWVEDPSNEDRAHERVRIRQALVTLKDLGISTTALSRSARRLHMARTALDHQTDELSRACLDVHDGSCAILAPKTFDAAPPEVRIRLLQRLWPAVAGADLPPRRSQLESLIVSLDARPAPSVTLGGALIIRNDEAGQILLYRELGREGLPVLVLQPGDRAIWDGRFEVRHAGDAPGPVTIRALQPTEASPATMAGARSLARRSVLTLPAAWDATKLLGVLHPAFPGVAGVEARFLHSHLEAKA